MRFDDTEMTNNEWFSKPDYSVRFWNAANECIRVGGKYIHEGFRTYRDAWDAANALLISAHKHGAVEMDINNDFYDIIED